MIDKLNAMKWTIKQWEWMLEHGPEDATIFQLKNMAIESGEVDIPSIPLVSKCYLCTYTEQFYSKSKYYHCNSCPMYAKWPTNINIGRVDRCISFGSLFSDIESKKKKDYKKEIEILVNSFRECYQEMKENYTEEESRFELAHSITEKMEEPWFIPFWLVQYRDYLENKNEKLYLWEEVIIDRFKSFDFDSFKKELSKIIHEYYDNKRNNKRNVRMS